MISKFCARPASLLRFRAAFFSSSYTSIFATNIP